MSPATALATKLAHLFDAGGAMALCGHYTFPLPVQGAEGYHLFYSPQGLSATFTAFLDDHARLGLGQPTARIAATEMPQNNRFRIWADWTFAGTPREHTRRYRTIYYCSLIGRSAGIDMIQCSGTIANPTGQRAPERKSA
jgi:hypothetical protein